MKKKQIKHIQGRLNWFTRKYLEGIGPILVDGDKGSSTNKRIKEVKHYLGYGKSNADLPLKFRLRLHYPHKRILFTKGMWTRGFARRKKQRAEAQKVKTMGFGTFDGRTAPNWMIPWLEKSRANGWRGTVVSGVRTPAYSEQLCYAMCGAPFCSGRCAGRASNHNMEPYQGYPHGALDVSDYYNFGAIQKRIGSPLKNALGAKDPVHFSVSGR